ncbi:hypothetical protein V8C37DRAFT_413076 [Trichoderma ceciliae]
MPTYLCHGFRWTRRLIRIFVILEDLDDAAPDWITGRSSSAAILERFSTKFDYLPQRLSQKLSGEPSGQQSGQQSEHQPEHSTQDEKQIAHQDDNLTVPPSRVPDCEDSVLANQSSAVKLLEEYDPEETSISARPFAYVADHVVRIDLSAKISDEMARYKALIEERNEGNWLERLRNELQDGAHIGWYVVVNGDEERAVPQYDDGEAGEGKLGGEEENEPKREQQTASSSQSRTKDRQHTANRTIEQPHSLRHKISRAGLRRLFSKREPPE